MLLLLAPMIIIRRPNLELEFGLNLLHLCLMLLILI